MLVAPPRKGKKKKQTKALVKLDKPKKKPVPPEDDENDEQPGKALVSGEEVSYAIARLLKLSTFEPERKYWLKTGSVELNSVLGSRLKGIPFGRVIELAGEEHGGKSTVSNILAGLAQKQGAAVGRVLLEDPPDDPWDEKMGLDIKAVVNIYPKLVIPKPSKEGTEDKPVKGKPKKKKRGESKIPRLQSAEELFDEAETGMMLLAKAGYKKQFWIVDSVANIQTMMAIDAGTNRNMRVSLDRAAFLSYYLPRLAGLAANYNALIFLINQLRDKQGPVWGDQQYSPGGRALRHCCAVRARIRRVKNGRILMGGKTVGLVGVIKNIKNKAGGGSVQDEQCGFEIRWRHDPARFEFMSKSEVEDRLK